PRATSSPPGRRASSRSSTGATRPTGWSGRCRGCRPPPTSRSSGWGCWRSSSTAPRPRCRSRPRARPPSSSSPGRSREAAAMFVVFEGIDGSGKTTISNRAAAALRVRGLTVEHVREGGAFASGVTQRIRDFCRDARNLALTPRAEFLLYVAREVQLGEEALGPALRRADVVIADRYLYTAEVLAREGRDLPAALVRPVLDAAAGGLWPDLALLIDVEPSVARGRRKVAKINSPDQRPGSRKGLAGSGLQQRLREGYRALAAREPG